MYHAQLIRGWRYAELYTTDGLFAVIILFCHFCIILMLLCFWDWSKAKDDDDYDSGEGGVTKGIEDHEEMTDKLGFRMSNSNNYVEGVINL